MQNNTKILQIAVSFLGRNNLKKVPWNPDGSEINGFTHIDLKENIIYADQVIIHPWNVP